MLAATRAPELFLALGMWEPPMVPWEWWNGKQAWDITMHWAMYDDTRQLGEDFNRQILGDERWEQLRESTRDLLRSEGAAFRADMMSQREPFLDLDHLKVPTLVGCGTVHADAGFRHAHERLAERIDAELFVAEGADHFAHTNHPAAWVELAQRTVALAHTTMESGRSR
jgi:pimeloyl-ACP methyl ester carboxylesterase